MFGVRYVAMLDSGQTDSPLAHAEELDDPPGAIVGTPEHTQGANGAAALGGSSSYYPEHLSPMRGELPVLDDRFAELREDWLLNIPSDRTAMAYWGDLERFHDWCLEQQVRVMDPGSRHIQGFIDQQLAAGYSPNSVARRLTAFRGFYAHLAEVGEIQDDPTRGLAPVRRRLSNSAQRQRARSAQSRIAARRLRRRDYEALSRRLERQGMAPEAQLLLLLHADGLNDAQVRRFIAAKANWAQISRTLIVPVADHRVVANVRLRLPAAVIEYLLITSRASAITANS